MNPIQKKGASKNQGEGDREAARRFNKAQKNFVDADKVTEAADRAAPQGIVEADQLESAEHVGRSRAKGEDPTVPGANAGRPRQP